MSTPVEFGKSLTVQWEGPGLDRLCISTPLCGLNTQSWSIQSPWKSMTPFDHRSHEQALLVVVPSSWAFSPRIKCKSEAISDLQTSPSVNQYHQSDLIQHHRGRKNHPVKLYPSFWPIKFWNIMKWCCFEILCFGMICYTGRFMLGALNAARIYYGLVGPWREKHQFSAKHSFSLGQLVPWGRSWPHCFIEPSWTKDNIPLSLQLL